MIPTYGKVFFDRWTPVALGIILFIFCGFGRDAVRVYRMILWRLGCGYFFGTIGRPLDSQTNSQPVNSYSTTLVGENVRPKKQLFPWRKSSRDVENGVQPSRHTHTLSTPWFRDPLSLFHRRFSRSNDQDNLLNELVVPGQTVRTNAWAETSQTRSSFDLSEGVASPTQKDTIRIKHVISQQSEVQLR